jgi:hypothetical protein
MTCIVGLEVPWGVIIGGDSSAASGWDIYTTRLPKVFRLGDFLIGYTTSFRMGQLLQYRLSVEDQFNDQADMHYMVTTFVDAVRVCLKEGGFTKIENEQEEGGQFLIGYRGKLYEVASDFQVNSSEDGFYAVGCGANCALGSLWSTKIWENPDARVIKALEAAGHFSNGVRPPYYVEFLYHKESNQ